MLKDCTLDQVIRFWANHGGEKLAIESLRRNERVSYAGLEEMINHLSFQLEGDIQVGDRCVLFLNDTIICHAMVHTVFRLGGILVPVDTQWGLYSKKNIIRHVGPTLLLGNDVEEISEQVLFEGHRFINYTQFESTSHKCSFPSRAKLDAVAMIAYTSGTTSDPKGIVLTHQNLRFAYRYARLHMASPERVGCVFRIATLGTLGIHFFYAQECHATTVILPELTLLNVTFFWVQYEQARLDFIYLVPSFVKMLNHFAKVPEVNLRDRNVQAVSAGAPLSEAEQIHFQEKFGIPLRNIYGLTESSFAVFYGDICQGWATNSIGMAQSVLAKIVNEQGIEVAVGQRGELIYKAPMVSFGYYKNDEQTRQIFKNGWLYTGDIAYQDSQGRLFIAGRKKDIVIRGGFNIYTQEVEECILKHPCVVNVCVMGLQNPVKGEELIAYVQINEIGIGDQTDFIQELKNDMGGFRTPDRFIFSSESIPLNSAGKKDKKAIADLFAYEQA